MSTKEEQLIKAILEAFPDLKFNFKRIDEWLTIKPDSFLGAENFAKVRAKLNELNAEYVSAGKLTHFRIALEPVKEKTLQEWYDEQRLKDKPMISTLTLNLNLQVTDPAQLEKILLVLKKYVIPEKGGRK